MLTILYNYPVVLISGDHYKYATVWQYVTCSNTCWMCDLSHNTTGWFKATQAMITIGFIGTWFAMIFISLYMCMCLNLVKKTFLLTGVILSSAFSSEYRSCLLASSYRQLSQVSIVPAYRRHPVVSFLK